MIRALARAAGWFLFGTLVLTVGYTGASFGLMLVPVNADLATGQPVSSLTNVNAFVISNGVHAEFVFPLHRAGMEWRTLFPAKHFRRVHQPPAYVSIGWGDREFYLSTPQWRDLTVGRAGRALLGGNPSLIHVTYIADPALVPGVRRLPLSAAQYEQLVHYVTATLLLEDDRPVHLPGAHYGHQDAFYQALGSYNAFNTCNAWIGRGLRDAGVVMGAWTPFDVNVLLHLDRL